MEADTYRIKLPKLDLNTVDAKGKTLLEKSKKDNGMIPNMFSYMANYPALLETYMNGYDSFRKEGGFTPAEQEVVFLTISAENDCDYCMSGHAVAADLMSGVPVPVTEAILANKDVPDAKLGALSIFTSVMVNKRGNPSTAEVESFLKAGYTEKHILAIVHAIALKTISNYNNHLFGTPEDAFLKTRDWTVYKVARSVVNFFRK